MLLRCLKRILEVSQENAVTAVERLLVFFIFHVSRDPVHGNAMKDLDTACTRKVIWHFSCFTNLPAEMVDAGYELKKTPATACLSVSRFILSRVSKRLSPAFRFYGNLGIRNISPRIGRKPQIGFSLEPIPYTLLWPTLADRNVTKRHHYAISKSVNMLRLLRLSSDALPANRAFTI